MWENGFANFSWVQGLGVLDKAAPMSRMHIHQEVTHFAHSASYRMTADPSVEETVLSLPLETEAEAEGSSSGKGLA